MMGSNKPGQILCFIILLVPGWAGAQELAGNTAVAMHGEMAWWAMTKWPAWVAGACIGVLIWLSFLLSNKPLGVSTSYARLAGFVEKAVTGRNVEEEKEYFQKVQPKVGWEMIMVVGLIIGAFISAWLSGDFRLDWAPARWTDMFGETEILRVAVAFVGGVIMMIGARWAGGCTSGHGLSGTLQLAVSSWLAVICFFVGGVLTAFLLIRPLAGG